MSSSIHISTGGTFNLTGIHVTPEIIQQVTELFAGSSIAAVALTVFNFFAAVLAAVLISVDNRRFHKSWKVAPSNRVPLSLAIAISISHLFFILKAFNGEGRVASTCALFMGRSTEPNCSKGCPHASRRCGSM